MTEKRYKATRPDGTDFRTGRINYAAALASGEKVVHPDTSAELRPDAAYYLSVATVPTDCTGMSWPCRLFEVEPDDEWTPEPSDMPNKRATLSLRVVAELEPHVALGANGQQIVAIIIALKSITYKQAQELGAARGAARVAAWGAAWVAAWDAARGAAWDAARGAAWVAAWDAARGAAWDAARDATWDAARDAAWDAARGAAWDAARDAILALLTQDIITAEQFEILTGPWASVMGSLEVSA
jgi:hypothetical protein